MTSRVQVDHLEFLKWAPIKMIFIEKHSRYYAHWTSEDTQSFIKKQFLGV